MPTATQTRLRTTRYTPPATRLKSIATGGPSINFSYPHIDFENRVIIGGIIAARGKFKNEHRGQFSDVSLAKLYGMMRNADATTGGLASRFDHPDGGSGLGWQVGRFRNPRLDGKYLRADLYFNAASQRSPFGDLSGYVLDLLAEDPRAIDLSLAGNFSEESARDSRGQLAYGEPPVWMPRIIFAADLVTVGEAVPSLLGTTAAGRSPSELLYELRLRQLELRERQAAHDVAMYNARHR